MNQTFIVGKYTLESLTNGMYSSPLVLYREYIQNAVDSIDEAIKMGITSQSDACIDIALYPDDSIIRIKDNGCGINIENAGKFLIDIGNSKKCRTYTRGFRGIGRLAGLGYCNALTFITSAKGETQKTEISFDAAELKKLLIPGTNDDDSIYDVINKVVNKKVLPEKASEHYFEVVLSGIDKGNDIIVYESLKKYLTQNIPLPFSPDFKWRKTISSKIKMNGYIVPEYNVYLTVNGKKEQLYKPYKDTIISDRVKKLEDNIRDIQVEVIGDNKSPMAIIWYASTNFFGTIIDTSIKGLRIRQGNILIGNGHTCSQFFKEERFNGWVIGEIHILTNNLIANSRRDNFEQNEYYQIFATEIEKTAILITKELRKLSYERSLSNEKKIIAEAESIADINSLCVEDMDFANPSDEYTLMNMSDSELEAENDFVNKLSLLLNQKQSQTKYLAININNKLTHEQRKSLERVFDLISQIYPESTANDFINTIASKF